MGRYTEGGVGRDVLGGAAAGIAAIWVANKLDQAIYRAGSPASIRKTEAARPGGMDPAHAIAKKAADAVGMDVSDPKDNPVGHTVQYGMAAALGALYGLLRGMSPAITTARGSIFGVALFVLKDEIANPAMGTAGNPLLYPARDHARGAATHAAFGILTDLGTRLLSPWKDEVVIERGPPIAERIEHGRDYLLEHGRSTLDQGRSYLDQGLSYAAQLAEQARARIPEDEIIDAAQRGRSYAGQMLDAVRSRLPDADDAADFARSTRTKASRFAGDVRSRLPDADDAADFARTARSRAERLADDARARLSDVDVEGLTRAGRRRANRLANQARDYVPDVPTTGLSRMITRLFG